MTDTLLKLSGISKTFRQGAHEIRAVEGISLDVSRGECVGLVGESGSGKSTLANIILGVLRPTSGSVEFNGEVLPAKRVLKHRRVMQLVQQNPLSSLNPNRSIGSSLRLALDVHKIGAKRARRARVGELLEEVGLPARYASRPPSALSGGEMQRVAIARALACESELVVLDEPTSALDVIVQARVLGLLNKLRSSRGLTYIFITHDLAVVRNVSERVLVLKEGMPVELNDVGELFQNPEHPYTRKLIAASPVITQAEQELRERARGVRE